MNKPLKTVQTGELHEKFRNDLIAVMQRYGDNLPAHELLATCAFMLGQMIALQDQRRFTAAEVMAMVSANIQEGNKAVIEDLLSKTGGSA